jgi:hypothetical protein
MAVIERIAEANAPLIGAGDTKYRRRGSVLFLQEHPGAPLAVMFTSTLFRDSAAIKDAHARYQIVSNALEEKPDAVYIPDFILTELEPEQIVNRTEHAVVAQVIEATRLLITARSLANIAQQLVRTEISTI